MATVGLTAVDGAYAGLAFVSFLLFGLVVLDGFHPPPVCELQFVHELESVLYRGAIAFSLSQVPLVRASVRPYR